VVAFVGSPLASGAFHFTTHNTDGALSERCGSLRTIACPLGVLLVATNQAFEPKKPGGARRLRATFTAVRHACVEVSTPRGCRGEASWRGGYASPDGEQPHRRLARYFGGSTDDEGGAHGRACPVDAEAATLPGGTGFVGGRRRGGRSKRTPMYSTPWLLGIKYV
jgi:hypothetical protein